MDTIQPGDRVRYIPAECHALMRDPNTGEYPWVHGRKHHRYRREGNRDVPHTEVVEHPTARHVDDHLDQIRKSGNIEERQHLVAVRPCTSWPAVIRTVHEDGSADLDVTRPNSGVTLHEIRVAFDPAGKVPHSFHLAGD